MSLEEGTRSAMSLKATVTFEQLAFMFRLLAEFMPQPLVWGRYENFRRSEAIVPASPVKPNKDRAHSYTVVGDRHL